jgi:TatA/E family protein of Tat protein translocase
MNIFSNIGITELIFILLLVLVIFGPDRLPELARTLGKITRDLRNMYTNLTRDLGPEMEQIQKATKEVRDTVGAVQDLPRSVTRSVLAMSEVEAMKDDLDQARQAAATLQDPRKLLEPATKEVEAIKDELDRTRRAAADQPRPVAPTPEPEAAAAPPAEPAPAPEPAAEPASEAANEGEQPLLFEPHPNDDEATGDE